MTGIRIFRCIAGLGALAILWIYAGWQVMAGVWIFMWAHNLTFHIGQKPVDRLP